MKDAFQPNWYPINKLRRQQQGYFGNAALHVQSPIHAFRVNPRALILKCMHPTYRRSGWGRAEHEGAQQALVQYNNTTAEHNSTTAKHSSTTAVHNSTTTVHNSTTTKHNSNTQQHNSSTQQHNSTTQCSTKGPFVRFGEHGGAVWHIIPLLAGGCWISSTSKQPLCNR